VVARAIIRDRASGAALAKNMALASAIFSAGPIFAPLIGIAIAEWIGHWRAVFVVLLLFGALLMLGLLVAPETLARKRRDALAPATLYANAATILAHRQSRYFMLLSALGMTQMVSIIASAPRVYEMEFGVTGRLFALLFALHGIGIIVGQFLNHRLIGRLGVAAAALAATGILIASSAAMALFAYSGLLSLYGLTALLLCFAMGYLAMMANYGALVLDPHGAIAGFTTSFAGCFAQFFGAIGATFVAFLTAGRILPLALFLLAVSAINAAALIHWRGTAPPARR
jgi:DHA1 family bicyclomycin/chloramphenicol resistance-like MFS transporter